LEQSLYSRIWAYSDTVTPRKVQQTGDELFIAHKIADIPVPLLE